MLTAVPYSMWTFLAGHTTLLSTEVVPQLSSRPLSGLMRPRKGDPGDRARSAPLESGHKERPALAGLSRCARQESNLRPFAPEVAATVAPVAACGRNRVAERNQGLRRAAHSPSQGHLDLARNSHGSTLVPRRGARRPGGSDQRPGAGDRLTSAQVRSLGREGRCQEVIPFGQLGFLVVCDRGRLVVRTRPARPASLNVL